MANLSGPRTVMTGGRRRPRQAIPAPTARAGDPARVIAFLGASGGAGVSCLAAATALTLASSGLRVACLDRDPAGGGIDVVFGVDHVRGVRWPALLAARGDVDPHALLRELPCEEGVWLVSHGREGLTAVPPEADTAILTALISGVDVVVIDAGRPQAGSGPDPVAGADDVILVVDATPQSMAAAGGIADSQAEHGSRWWLAQRTPRGLGHLPDTVASALGLPVAAVIGTDSRCAAALLDGIPPGRRGPLAKAAEQLTRTVLAERSWAA